MRTARLETSLFEMETGYQMPVAVRTQILSFLRCTENDACEFCRVEIDPLRMSTSDSFFTCEEVVNFVGSDGLGPFGNSIVGRTLKESLSNRRFDTVYFFRHKERDDCNFIVFQHIPSENRDKEKYYIAYNQSQIDNISSLLTDNIIGVGGFWYGNFRYPKEGIIGDHDQSIHLEKRVREVIFRNTVEFLSRESRKKFEAIGVKPKRGVLLSGRPGTGKTAITRIVMRKMIESGTNAVFLDPQSIRSRHMTFLDLYRFATSKAPVLIVIDDIDLFFSDRDFKEGHNILADMLQALDGVQSNSGVVTLASTNDLDSLDDALTRPGRFDVHVQVEPPDDPHYLSEIVRRQFVEVIADGTISIDGLTGLTPAQVVECCNRYKMEIVLSEQQYVWDPVSFEKVVGDFRAERRIKE